MRWPDPRLWNTRLPIKTRAGMVVWQSPVITYWYASVGLRRSYLSPAVRDQCFCALVDLAQRSDSVGERAREALIELRKSRVLEGKSSI